MICVNNQVPEYQLTINELHDVDVLIPNNLKEFKFMWDLKLFDIDRELFNKPNEPNKPNKQIDFIDNLILDDQWLFINRSHLNYMTGNEFWRCSPEFKMIILIISETLKKNDSISISFFEEHYNKINGNKKRPICCNFPNKKIEQEYNMLIKFFCELAEYSNNFRTGKYIRILQYYKNKIITINSILYT